MHKFTVRFVSAMALSAGMAGAASAQMTSDDIYKRLIQQGQSATTTYATPGTVTRGLSFDYGEPEPEPAAAAAPAPAPVAAAPVAQPAPAPAPAPAPTFVAIESQPEAIEPLRAPGLPTIATVAPEVSADDAMAAAPVALPQIEAAPALPTPAYTSTFAPRPAPQPAAPTFVDVTPAAVPATVQPARVEPAATASAPASDDYTPVQQEARVDLEIFFEWNSAALKPEAISQLTALCTALQRVTAEGGRQFRLIGHTDKSGDEAYNLYLSRARAREVRRHLIEECALPGDALIAIGEGERQAPADSPAQSPDERRVEVQLVV